MTNTILKKTIFISLLGHITVFGIFRFTFGDRILKANYAYVYFLGAILRSSDLLNRPFTESKHTKVYLSKRSNTSVLGGVNKEDFSLLKSYFKPRVSLPVSAQKIIPSSLRESVSFIEKRKEPIIMFYPRLPYHFLLYFKDRQRVHIELMFNTISDVKTSTILIKRKISSGNLEADLLSMRYISHYLFLQQTRFVPNVWQTVKIDLSAKDDK